MWRLAWLIIGGGIVSLLVTAVTPSPSTPVPLTPTPDRLAAPPTVPSPTQADEGAQLFWLHCQPCHGDQGQGLTDEWRAQYPPEDQNCWKSGCHGLRPYDDGFVLPTAVPPVIGGQSLNRFATLQDVYNFVHTAMPFQDPGSLTQDEYLAIVAFLGQKHGLWRGHSFDIQTLEQAQLNTPTPAPIPQPTLAPVIPTAVQPPSYRTLFVLGGIFFALLGGFWLWQRSLSNR